MVVAMPRDGATIFSDLIGKLDVLVGAKCPQLPKVLWSKTPLVIFWSCTKREWNKLHRQRGFRDGLRVIRKRAV